MSVYYFYPEPDPLPFTYLSPVRQIGELPVPYTTSMTPSGYLEFAIEDLAVDDTRGCINAFSNVKRAIHLLIDMLLNQYGLFFHYKKSKFPAKLEILDSIGLIPIGVMRNLNLERNMLEHEYSTPEKERVKEAVDVAKLLLMATEKLREATPQEVLGGWKVPSKQFLLRVEPQRGDLEFFEVDAPDHYKEGHGIRYIGAPFRTFQNNDYSPGISISDIPWMTIQLNRAHEESWKPIIRELVNLQRRSTFPTTFRTNDLTVTFTVTVPWELPANLSLSTAIDNSIALRNQHDSRANLEGVESRPDRDPSEPPVKSDEVL